MVSSQSLFSAQSRRRFAAVAYVSDDTYVRFHRDDCLMVDASDGAIASGETSKVLARAFRAGCPQTDLNTRFLARDIFFTCNSRRLADDRSRCGSA